MFKLVGEETGVAYVLDTDDGAVDKLIKKQCLEYLKMGIPIEGVSMTSRGSFNFRVVQGVLPDSLKGMHSLTKAALLNAQRHGVGYTNPIIADTTNNELIQNLANRSKYFNTVSLVHKDNKVGASFSKRVKFEFAEKPKILRVYSNGDKSNSKFVMGYIISSDSTKYILTIYQ